MHAAEQKLNFDKNERKLEMENPMNFELQLI